MGGEDAELRPGDHFAGLRIDRVAGRRTYRATDPAHERVIALRFGGDAPAGVEHPNILPVLHAGPGYVTARWVEGDDLATLLSTGGGLDAGHVLAIAGQVAAALDAAHAHGVVHGGLKPALVLLEGDHAWVTGFGGGPAPDYRAPEGGASVPGDVYALGAIVWEALTGRPPHLFDADPEPPSVRDLRPDLPEALNEVLARALAPDPARRWKTAGGLIRAARGSATPT
jgi:serine/threonine-protein kinase